MERSNNNDDSVLLTVGGASTTDTSQTFSISSESTERETPNTKKVAMAMPAKEILRPSSAPHGMQKRKATQESSPRTRRLSLPATHTVRSGSRRSGRTQSNSESGDKSRSRSDPEEKEKRRAERKSSRLAIKDSPRDRRPPTVTKKESTAMEIEDIKTTTPDGAIHGASGGGTPAISTMKVPPPNAWF